MSSLPKLKFPETLGGGRHRIASPPSRDAEKPDRCAFVTQDYPCPQHPSLTTPHLLHRLPCPQALLPPSQQTKCANYARREGEVVRIFRYARERGCMTCQSEVRARRKQDDEKQEGFLQKMTGLGLGREQFTEVVEEGGSTETRRVGGVLEAKRERKRSEVDERKMGSDEQRMGETDVEAGTVREDVSKDEERVTGDEKHVLRDEAKKIKNIGRYDATPKMETSSLPSPESPNDKKEVTTQTKKSPQAESNTTETKSSHLFFTQGKASESVVYVGEFGDEWDWGMENEKMWGEVALAPGATTETRDQWVVIGSWGEDEWK